MGQTRGRREGLAGWRGSTVTYDLTRYGGAVEMQTGEGRFNVQAAEAFEAMQDDVADSVRASLARIEPGKDGVDLSHLAPAGPASTWTYLVNDDPFRNQLGAMLTGPGRRRSR